MRLSEEHVKTQLSTLKGWELSGNSITKLFRFEDFVSSVDFVNKLVPIAEKMEHHPDLEIKNYNQVTISLTTHDEGGLTDLDFELAREIEKIAGT